MTSFPFPPTSARALTRAEAAELIRPVSFAAIEALAPRDPFGVDDPCPASPAGHQAIASCSDLVCPHCGKVFWI